MAVKKQPAGFVGREWLLESLQAWLSEGPPVAVLVGEPGIGKSALAQELRRQAGGLSVEIRPALGTHLPDGFWNALLEQVDLEGSRLPQTATMARRLAEDYLRGTPLIIVDAIDRSPELLDWIPSSVGDIRWLLTSRPGAHLITLEQAGAHLIRMDSLEPRNVADVKLFLKERGLKNEALTAAGKASHGNFRIAAWLATAGLEPHQMSANSESLDRALWAEVESVLQPLSEPEDARRILGLLSEAGEALDPNSIADFLGLTVGRVRQLLARLAPLLHDARDRYRLYSPRLARTLARYLERDLVGVHASVVAFFRETYPSWDEMNDDYGWNYLGHHCERYARTSRKRDYSVLHWLGEGSFLRLKLQRTRSLRGVLEDLSRGLRAALEEQDLPRIVHYGLQIPRLRMEEGATGLHELADMGHLELARERAALLAGEASRFKAFLLLAWQALDEDHPALLHRLLEDALAVPLPVLDDEDVPLVVRIVGDLAAGLPERVKDVLSLLDREENPGRSAGYYLGLSRLDSLPEKVRLQALEAGVRLAQGLDEAERVRVLPVFAAGLRELGKEAAAAKLGAGPEAAPNHRFEFLTAEQPAEAFSAALLQVANDRLEPRRLQSLSSLAAQLARTDGAAWAFESFQQLMNLVVQLRTPAERLRGVLNLSRSLTDLGPRELSMQAFERLAAVAQTLEDETLRARALADIGLSLHKLREHREASAKISEAAGLAMRIEEPLEKARTLAFVAGAVAQFGHRLRARDLAFHSLQVHEAPSPIPYDQNCRASLKLGVMATISHERTLEYLQGGAESAKRIEQLEPQHRAASLATLASGALRLGSLDWARKLLNQALGAARAMDAGAAKAEALASLAAQEAEAGDTYRAEQVLGEALEAIEPEPNPSYKAQGYMAVASAREAMRDPRAKAAIEAALDQLEQLPGPALAGSGGLFEICGKAQRWHIASRVGKLLKKARQHASEEDVFQLALLRAELAFGDLDAAQATQRKLAGTEARSQGLAETAVRLILSDPEEALRLLQQIPLRSERMTAVRRCTVELARELRPSHQKVVQDTLAELTLLSTEDEGTADLVVSRWVYFDQDPQQLERTARKMGWVSDDGMTPLTPSPARELSPLQLRQSV